MLTRTPWFKNKNYGWGWYPATWQGWSVLLVFLLLFFWRATTVSALFDTNTSFVFRYLFEVWFLVAVLLVICFLTGEKPEWRWGGKPIRRKK